MVATEVEGEGDTAKEEVADEQGKAWEAFKEICDVADSAGSVSVLRELVPSIKKLASLVDNRGITYEQTCLLLLLAVARKALDSSGPCFALAEDVLLGEDGDDAAVALVTCIEGLDGDEDAELGAGRDDFGADDDAGALPEEEEVVGLLEPKVDIEVKRQLKTARVVLISLRLQAASLARAKIREQGPGKEDLKGREGPGNKGKSVCDDDTDKSPKKSKSRTAKHSSRRTNAANHSESQGDKLGQGTQEDPPVTEAPPEDSDRSMSQGADNGDPDDFGSDHAGVQDDHTLQDYESDTCDPGYLPAPAKRRKRRETSSKQHLAKGPGKLKTEAKETGEEDESPNDVEMKNEDDPDFSPAKSNAVRCSDCGKLVANRGSLILHSRRKHSQEICSKCGDKFQTREELDSHKNSAHPVKKKESRRRRSGEQKCADCGCTVATVNSLARHARAAHGHEMCHCCGEVLASRELLEEHRRIAHLSLQRNSGVCDACGKAFWNIRRHHRTVHEGIRRETPCDICGKLFPPRYIERHKILVHPSEDTPTVAQCNICGKTFRDEVYYDWHMKSHYGERYPCQVCGKTYHRPSVRNEHHRRVHLGMDKKPFACDVCGKRFSRPFILRVHTRSVHEGAKPYSCDICKKSFTQSGSVYIHKRKVHKLPV